MPECPFATDPRGCLEQQDRQRKTHDPIKSPWKNIACDNCKTGKHHSITQRMPEPDPKPIRVSCKNGHAIWRWGVLRPDGKYYRCRKCQEKWDRDRLKRRREQREATKSYRDKTDRIIKFQEAT